MHTFIQGQGLHTPCTLILFGASLEHVECTLSSKGRVRTHLVHSYYLVRPWNMWSAHFHPRGGFAHALYTHIIWCVLGTCGVHTFIQGQGLHTPCTLILFGASLEHTRESSAIMHFIHSDVFEIVGRIIFNFHPELPHM